jgi:hypothetical protein
MILVCVNAFGNFEPGDEIEMPDDAEFDHAFFKAKPEAKPEADKENDE